MKNVALNLTLSSVTKNFLLLVNLRVSQGIQGFLLIRCIPGLRSAAARCSYLIVFLRLSDLQFRSPYPL